MSLQKGKGYPWAQPYTWEENFHGPNRLGKYLKPFGLLWYHGIVIQLPFGPISSAAKLDRKAMQWSWDVDLSIPFVDLPTHIRYAHFPDTPDIAIEWKMVDLAGGTFLAEWRLRYDNYVWVPAGGALGVPHQYVVTGGFDGPYQSLGLGFAFYSELP